MSGPRNPLERIEDFIDLLDRSTLERRDNLNLRYIKPDDIINDSLEDYEYYPDEEVQVPEIVIEENEVIDFNSFNNGDICDIAAIDSGIVRLGETKNGLFFALRGSIIIDSNHNRQAYLFRTGPRYLSFSKKLELLYRIGQDLLRPNLFVELDNSDQNNPVPIQVKKGVADDSHQYADRFRNWFERLLQLIALERIHNGVVLFDGALTLRTRDTPSTFLNYLSTNANVNNNAIIAISKQSNLQVRDVPIHFWLDEESHTSGYKRLTSLLTIGRQQRILGNLYAVRFTPAGPTFRMDVKAVDGQRDKEAIDNFYISCLMKAGFPDILVRAHAHSYFTSGDVTCYQSWIRANYNIIPKLEVNLGPPFAPFGGRFK